MLKALRTTFGMNHISLTGAGSFSSKVVIFAVSGNSHAAFLKLHLMFTHTGHEKHSCEGVLVKAFFKVAAFKSVPGQ